MILPVYVPDWQIGDGDIEHPYVGMSLSHVLLFRTKDKDPDLRRKLDPELSPILGKAHRSVQSGQEVTVTGVAKPLGDQSQHALGAFPTAIHCEGLVLYWDAPAMTEGPVTLTGIVDATDYGTVPDGFPEASGVVDSMELVARFYVNEDGGGVNWAPDPDQNQQFRPISRYPRYVPETDTRTSPHMETTGVVLHLDINAVGAVAAGGKVGVDAESIITIRLFPDYAETVLWLYGPVKYADTKLSPALVADMEAWETTYYASLDGNQVWKSRSGAAQFTVTGHGLAQRLAKELGDGFEVEFHSYAPRSIRQLFRSEQHSQNPAAAEAFRAIMSAEEELQARFEADKANGVGWFAYAPLSGAVFDPGNNYTPGQPLGPGLEP